LNARPRGQSRRTGRSGRRTGDSGTSEAILDAARAQFAEHGYRGATIRAIAARAKVDPALVHHFYGTKEALFAAAMRLPVVPSEALTAAFESEPAEGGPGEQVVRSALTLWETDGLKETFLGLLKSAVTSEEAAIMLREFVAESILGTLVRVVGVKGTGAEVEYRAAMVATQMLGLAMTRLVLGLPAVTQVTVAELAATIGPSVERYLTGEIELPDRFAGIDAH
jgi:AcrR family transcriptional regulator